VAWAAVAIYCFGTAARIENPFSAIGAVAEVVSVVVGVLAEVPLVGGVACVVLRRSRDTWPEQSAPEGRYRRVIVGVAAGVAILGGLLAAVGYFAVAALEQTYTIDADVSLWDVSAVDPGVARFIAGSVVLLAALLIIRLHVRPTIGGRFVWASAWLFWVAIGLNCLGLVLAVDPGSGSGSSLFLVSLIVEIAAVLLLLFGLRLLFVRARVRRRPASMSAVRRIV